MEETRIHLDPAEALRYAGVRGEAPPELWTAVLPLAEKLEREAPPRWLYRVYPVERGPDGITLSGSGVSLPGKTAEKMLADCPRAALLACTLGARSEALLRAETARGMDRALLLDACGSALVEAGCDAAGRAITARFPGQFLTDRFSPGYGDLPLNVQASICAALDINRRLGVQLTESLLMNPTKSVTAVIGLSPRPQPARVRGCAFCNLRETCGLRKEGKSCVSG